MNKTIWHIINKLKKKQSGVWTTIIPKKILIMRYGFLGDVLQTTPVIKVLQRTSPDARIDYWVSDAAAAALKNNPHVSSIISADSQGVLSLRSFFSVLRHAMMMRRAHYDLAICLGPDPFYGFLAWLAGIEVRAGLIVNKGKAAFLDVCVETPLADSVSRQQRYLELLRRLNIDAVPEDEKIQIFWSAEDEQKTDSILGHESGKLMALFCGTGPARFRPWANRRWGIDLWMSLAKRIIQHYPDIKIVLIGADLEAETNKRIASVLPKAKVIDLSGKTSFSQLGTVLKRCRLLVSNDSAPVFVAAAVGCPTVVIYGPEWPERARPLDAEEWYPVYADIDCRDYCASFPDKAPECKNECLSSIKVEMVLEKINICLNSSKQSMD